MNTDLDMKSTDKLEKICKRLDRVCMIMLMEPSTEKRPNLQQRLQELISLVDLMKSAIADLQKHD